MNIYEIALRYSEGDGLADLYKKTFPTRSHEPSKEQRALWNQAKKKLSPIKQLAEIETGKV
jgi:hypothetical protein